MAKLGEEELEGRRPSTGGRRKLGEGPDWREGGRGGGEGEGSLATGGVEGVSKEVL